MSYLVLTVLLGTAILGCVSGVIGSFAVLRRRALVGDLLSHAALPGICIAFWMAGERDYSRLMIGAFVSGLVGVALVSLITRWTRTKEDAAIGIVLSTFFGVGIVLTSIVTRLQGVGGTAGLERYTLGQAANLSESDVKLIAVVSVATLIAVAVLYKEFKMFSFDPEFAQSLGWPAFGLDLLMMGLLGIVAVVGVKAVGVLLVPALLITPGAAARFWTNRLETMLLLSAIFGTAAAAAGTLISAGVVTDWLGFDPLAFGYEQNLHKALPTGPVIVLSGTVIFLASMLFAPRRGVIARFVELVELRRRTARENLLRTMYEWTERQLDKRPEVARDRLLDERAWTPRQLERLLRWGARQRFVEVSPRGARLTEEGLREAAGITRAHRLWELFLIQGANIASDHVDRDADAIEHLLPPEMIDDLEEMLARQGRLPRVPGYVPQSPHELTSERQEPAQGGRS